MFNSFNIGFLNNKSHDIFSMETTKSLGYKEIPLVKSGAVTEESLKIKMCSLSQMQLKKVFEVAPDVSKITKYYQAAFGNEKVVFNTKGYLFNMTHKSIKDCIIKDGVDNISADFIALTLTKIAHDVKIVTHDGSITGFVQADNMLLGNDSIGKGLVVSKYDDMSFNTDEIVKLISTCINRNKVPINRLADFTANFFSDIQRNYDISASNRTYILRGAEVVARVLERKESSAIINEHAIVAKLKCSINFIIDYVQDSTIRGSVDVSQADVPAKLLYLTALEGFINTYFTNVAMSDMVSHINVIPTYSYDDNEVLTGLFLYKQSALPVETETYFTRSAGNLHIYAPTNWRPKSIPMNVGNFAQQLSHRLMNMSIKDYNEFISNGDDLNNYVMSAHPIMKDYHNKSEGTCDPILFTNLSNYEINLWLLSRVDSTITIGQDGRLKYQSVSNIHQKCSQIKSGQFTLTKDLFVTDDLKDMIFAKHIDQITDKLFTYDQPKPTIIPATTISHFSPDTFMHSEFFPDTADYALDDVSFSKDFSDYNVTLNVNDKAHVERLSIGQDVNTFSQVAWPRMSYVGHANDIIEFYECFRESYKTIDSNLSALKGFELTMLDAMFSHVPQTAALVKLSLGHITAKRDVTDISIQVALKYSTLLGRKFGDWDSKLVALFYKFVEEADESQREVLTSKLLRFD